MNEIPKLIRKNNTATLWADGTPWLIFGAEVRNSSASDLAYMENVVWPQVRPLGLNTLLVPVSWELLEPEPGVFDFTLPDGLIAQARREGVRLILLWFGLWKNGMSTYVPEWMRAEPDTYFHMRDRHGRRIDAVSPLCDAAVERDAAAFAALMAHLRDTDTHRTVLMVQVENEMGLLGECRDFSPRAQQAYESALPKEMARFAKDEGATWREAFGEQAPELFMTWCYAAAAQRIAAAGRREYALPLYVNAWLEQFPWTPGTYPVGGPIARHMEVWKALAPAIDCFAPDIYLPDFEQVCGEYAVGTKNPLFIPEARPCMDSASNVFSAFGRFAALGFSPFAAEDLCGDVPAPDPAQLQELNIMAEAFCVYRSGEFLAQSYRLLRGMQALLVHFRGTHHMTGFTQYRQPGELVSFTRYDFRIQYAPRSADVPKGGGLIIELSENEFLLCGLGYSALPLVKNDDPGQAEILSITEGYYEMGCWCPGRRLNGDERRLVLGSVPVALRCRLRRYAEGET
ncbi:MAG TPA: DUF5597 domain-containing protein [Candidatus Fimivicinus intestinavium]|nr:DUF5597 domain-containing protein [Candidatus Fimivicinus intestinavium]